MSAEKEPLSEEQRGIVVEMIKALCRYTSCRAASFHGCPRELTGVTGDRLPLCYARKSKRELLNEGVESNVTRDGFGPEMIMPILTFLSNAEIVTTGELKELYPPLTIKQIMEIRARETIDSRP